MWLADDAPPRVNYGPILTAIVVESLMVIAVLVIIHSIWQVVA